MIHDYTTNPPRTFVDEGEDFRSLVLPITRQLREHIQNCVLEKYQAAISENS